MRSRSSLVIPATGSSSSSRRGPCTSIMANSSHCCWPWDSTAGRPSRQLCQVHRFECLGDAGGGSPGTAKQAEERHAEAGREVDVLHHGQLFEHRRRLERAADAEADDLVLAAAHELRAGEADLPAEAW